MFFKKNYRAASKLPYPAAFFCFCPFYLQRGIQDLQESEEFQVQKENRWDSHPFTNILHQVTHRNTSAVCHKMPSSLSLDEVLLGFFFLTGSSGSWWSWWNTGSSWIQGKVLFSCDGLLRCTDPQSCRLQKLLPLNVFGFSPAEICCQIWRLYISGIVHFESRLLLLTDKNVPSHTAHLIWVTEGFKF